MRRSFLLATVVLTLLLLFALVMWEIRSPTSGSADRSNVAPTSQNNVAEYSDSQFKFSLQYPKDLEVHVFDEDDGSRTVTFEGQSPGVGFQIFIVPYDKDFISPQRFAIDEPSGVMKDPLDIKVGGASGKVFTGHNDQMGDTREVWFIHGGYLYEVVTYKPLDSWLADLMTSWHFL